jgi:hypothetical protein
MVALFLELIFIKSESTLVAPLRTADCGTIEALDIDIYIDSVGFGDLQIDGMEPTSCQLAGGDWTAGLLKRLILISIVLGSVTFRSTECPLPPLSTLN